MKRRQDFQSRSKAHLVCALPNLTLVLDFASSAGSTSSASNGFCKLALGFGALLFRSAAILALGALGKPEVEWLYACDGMLVLGSV